MTPSQITTVQASFAQVAPISEAAAAIFYARLFETAPQLRPLFKGDIEEQGRKLMATLAVAVAGLKDLDRLIPVVEALALRHVGYGVQSADYEPVGAALIHTLAQGLGEGFTPELEAAWTEAFATLSAVMIAAAYPVEAAP